jgi:hypothetical protein
MTVAAPEFQAASLPADAAPSPPAIRTPRPVFVIGSIRSGASLLTLCLGQHPALQPVLETKWFARFGAGLQEAYAVGVKSRATSQLDVAGIDLDDFYAHFGRAIDSLVLESVRDDGIGSQTRPARWIDGTPENRDAIPTLLHLFPHAKLIHVLRDVREVVTILTGAEYEQHYRSNHVMMTPEEAYRRWRTEVNVCVEAERAFGSDTIVRIRRADLVTSPEQTLRRCLDFLGEPFSPDCLRPLNPVGLVQTTPKFALREHFGEQPPLVCIKAEGMSDRLLAEGTPFYPRDELRILQLELPAKKKEKPARPETPPPALPVKERPPGPVLLSRLRGEMMNRFNKILADANERKR